MKQSGKKMLQRYKTKETQEAAETIYRLRQQGWKHQKIADETGKTLSMVVQTARNETAYRCMAFEYPFLEYIATRTANGIRKALGESTLGEPEKLSGIEQVKAFICMPGVSDKALKDLADGLAKAGYESFEPGKMKDAIFTTKWQAQRMRQERFASGEG